MATKAKSSTALTLWEQKMASSVTKQAASEKTSGFKSINLQGGVLSVDDVAMEGNELIAVILCSAHENAWYTSAYNPDKPAIPSCFAFSEVDGGEDGMAPHADSVDTHGDTDGTCVGCEHNQMGSADVGRGKACRNIRRMAVITADAVESADALNEAEVRMLKIPVMSVKGWAAYVKEKLGEEIKRPTWGVLTKIKVVADRKSQFRVTFAFEELINFDQKLFDAMESKIKSASASLVTPYVPIPEEEEDPATRRKGTPVRSTGRMAEAMAKSAAKQAGSQKDAPAKKAKY